MSEQHYAVTSGRRTIGIRRAPSAQMALLDQARSMGCRDSEITRLGVDSIAWRGAVFRASPVADPERSADG